MGLRINTNVAALNAHRNLGIADTNITKSLQRLSSGYRLNSAKDDAAGLSMAQKFRAQNMSLSAASRNTTQANAMLQVAEGGADQIHSMLIRLKELATQASSNNSSSNLTEIDAEAQRLKSEINRIANSTKYLDTSLLTGFAEKNAGTLTATDVYDFDVSGVSLTQSSAAITVSASDGVITLESGGVTQTLTASDGANSLDFTEFGVSFKTTTGFISSAASGLAAAVTGTITVSGTNADFQVGDKNVANNRISFTLNSIDYDVIGSATVGTSAAQLDDLALDSASHAQDALDIIDQAIDDVNTARGTIGAVQNRLDYTYANLAISMENLNAAESVIRDVDMASEMVNFTKNQILMQAGTAMLAQANMAPQSMLQLLG